MVSVTDHRLIFGATALALSLLGFGFFTDAPALLAYPVSLSVAVLAACLGVSPARQRERPSSPKEKR